MFISLIGSDGRAFATLDTFPGWGTLPTDWWEPGVTYRDDYILQIPDDAEGFSPAQLHIGWYAYPYGSNIQPMLENGEIAGNYFIPVGAFVGNQEARSIPTHAIASGAVFGEILQLEGYRWLEGNMLELHWQLLNEISGDWRVFAVVFADDFSPGGDNVILLQKDAAPPVPLDYLYAGETLRTIHAFEVPEESVVEHSIYVGWYNNELGERLALPFRENMLELPGLNFAPPTK